LAGFIFLEAISRFRYSLFQVSAALPPKPEKSSDMPLNRG
jgi:hypothetical protein